MCYRVVILATLLSFAPSHALLSGAHAVEEVFVGKTMGPVPYQVTVTQLPPGVGRDQIAAAITEELESVNQKMSTYQSNSDVSRFNRASSTDWYPVSRDTALVVKRSIELSIASDGAFDVTVAPLVNLWSFGPDGSPEVLPTDSEIEEALARVGYEALDARLEPPAIRKSKSELMIDLSAIAKGFAVDEVAQRLEEIGVSDYLVEVGGEVRTLGLNPRGSEWVLGIEEPIPTARVAKHTVPLSGKSLATSGDYRNFFVIDGTTYSHTIDTRTGRPVAHSMRSVSVVADDCITADAWATAMMVIGPNRIREVAEQANIEVFWIVSDPTDESELVHASTDGFPLLKQDQQDGNAVKSSIWPMFAAALIVFMVALVGMAIGVIFSNRTIKGSCGGLAALKRGDEKSPCEVCNSRATCDEYQAAISQGDKETVNASSAAAE